MVRWRRVAVAVVALAVAVLGWARFIEPRWLEVTHHAVKAPVECDEELRALAIVTLGP